MEYSTVKNEHLHPRPTSDSRPRKAYRAPELENLGSFPVLVQMKSSLESVAQLNPCPNWRDSRELAVEGHEVIHLGHVIFFRGEWHGFVCPRVRETGVGPTVVGVFGQLGDAKAAVEQAIGGCASG